MDWKQVSFDWNRVRAFVVTAEQGSFSAAARALGSTQPTLGRQVAALEETLGVTLFERVGTRLELTDSGVELLEHGRRMGEAALEMSLAAAGQSTLIEGRVTITSSEAIAAYWLPPVITALRQEHPRITIDIVASTEVRDLHRREADIAVRSVRPTKPDLYGRRVRDAQAGLYASPDYVARVGPLAQIGDLARAEFLAFDHGDTMLEALAGFGVTVTREQFPIVAANHLAQWALCRQGAGLCFMMTDVGDADPGVVRVVPDFVIPLQTWLVCHRELRTSRRLRIVFDRLAAALA